MSNTVPLSVIILAHRNDERLQQSVASADFATEVLVVDHSAHPILDFAQARNEALQKASQPWVFFLDSDEVIPPAAQTEIARLLESDVCDGISVYRQDFWQGKKLRFGEAGKLPLVRLGKREKIHFTRPIHEEAVISGVLCNSSITLEHYPHPTIQEFYDSIVGYAKREAAYRVEQKRTLFLPFIVLFPLGKFLLNYFLKLGFLDGWQGITYALMMSLHSLFVRVFWYEATHVTQSQTS